MQIEDINRIKENAKAITIRSVLRRIEIRDPKLPTEIKTYYRIELPEVVALLAATIGSGNIIYTNTAARVIDIAADFTEGTNDTGTLEWLLQSTAEWIACSFGGITEYMDWINHLNWSYNLINPVNKTNFDDKLIGLDPQVCERLVDVELGKILSENAFLVFLFTVQLSFNEIMQLLPAPPRDDDEESKQ